MGSAEVNKKKVNVDVVEGGTYKLEIPDTEQTYFSSEVSIRPYMQRFMYKRFVKGVGDVKNAFIKTVMADTLKIDLKDTYFAFIDSIATYLLSEKISFPLLSIIYTFFFQNY